MIDILIIVLFICVVLSNLLKAFKWFQEKFNVFGTSAKQDEKSQTLEQDLSSSRKINSSNNKQPSLNKSGQSKKIKQTVKENLRSEPSPLKINRNEDGMKRQTRDVSPALRKTLEQPSNQSFKDQERIKQLLEQNRILQNKIASLSSQRQYVAFDQSERESLKRQIEELSQSKQSLTVQLNSLKQLFEHERQNVENLTSQLFEVKRSSDNLINELQQKLIKQVQEQKIHIQVRNQLDRLTKECSKNQQTNNQVVTESNANDPMKDELIASLQLNNEQLKSELQFCQKQIEQYSQNQNKLKQQINKVAQIAETYKSKSKSSISINDVINHPQYLRIKEKLNKFEGNGLSSSRQKSTIRTEFTPQGQRGSFSGSRISERRSLISSKYTNQILGQKGEMKDEELFHQCNFLNQENKCFILQEIKKIKKLSIKKTKLIFKLDKLHPINPHEFIDNIPNIIILIELTNKKILGAFTQTAFCKDEAQLGLVEKNSPARPRFGANKALILDLTNKLAFPNNSANDTIIYDENAIVWGKDELVIKNDEPTLLYSSFGQQNAVYWDGKYTLEQFLGGSQGFERINQYEIHRVYIS